jgi:membrane fusion protein, multidrug efflux system
MKPSSPDFQDKKLQPGLVVFIIALIIICCSAGFYFYKNASAEQQPGSKHGKGERSDNQPLSVAAATSRLGDMPVFLNGLGTVTALRTVTVHTRVDGELMKVAFSEGQLVKQGELLAEIDPRPFQVQLKQAEGQLRRDQALLKNAKLDLHRYEVLQEQDSIASQQTATQAALVEQYQGAVEMDQAQVENAKLQLTYAHITAPISGRIGLRMIDQGNIVHAADTTGMLVITQMQPINVIFSLPEDVVPALIQRWRTGKTLVADAYSRSGQDKLATGKIIAIDNQIDTSTGTLKLKAQFENNDLSLFANQFVNIKMHLDTLQSVTLVPSVAIQRGADGALVYLVTDDNKISIKQVKIGPVDGETTAILEGLAANEKVVVDGIEKLREGSNVKHRGKPPA